MFAEWIVYRRPSILGIASGAVAGLVAITPAAGVASPMGALGLGAISGLVCFFSATWMKHRLGYDDSLDVFAVHGLGGIIGLIGAGLFASEGGLFNGSSDLIVNNLILIVSTFAYSIVVTFILLKLLDVIPGLGLRSSQEEEDKGLDISDHGERAYVADGAD